MNFMKDVFDAALDFSERVHLMDELQKTEIQILVMATTCGSCARWMTRSCPKEVRAGRKQGPSVGTVRCDQFWLGSFAEKHIAQLRERLSEIKLQLGGA